MKHSFIIPFAVAVAVPWVSLVSHGHAQEVIASEKEKFKVEVLAKDLKNPWGLVKLPDGRFLVTERPGTVRIIGPNGELSEPITGVPEVFARGQGGLLDVELHPDYATNGWIYLAYSANAGEKSLTKIVRGKLKENAFVDQEVIFEPPVSEMTGGGNHFGVRMEFDGKGHLFFTIGDRGNPATPENPAQRLDNVLGKTHRIFDDGRIPEDNPFYDRGGSARTIWTYGNRNAQGLKINPKTGDLWEVEHGPRGGDELNLLKKGANYGWPLVTFGINYQGTIISDKTEAEGFESPVTHWTPSIGIGAIDFYTGDKFPSWKGNLFVTALAHQKLIRIVLDEKNEVEHQEILLEKTGRIRDVRDFGDGYLYLVYDTPGQVVRLVPTET